MWLRRKPKADFSSVIAMFMLFGLVIFSMVALLFMSVIEMIFK